MLKIAVCDDIQLHLDKADEMTEHFLTNRGQSFSVKRFASSEDLLQYMEDENWLPDIAVLDIEMDGEDGISLAKKLNQKAPACRIIFLTAYIDHAPEAYEADHIWFVTKNRADEFFEPAMDKALRSLEEGETAVPGIIVRENGKKIMVPLSEIIYISKVGRKANIHCIRRDYYDTRRPALLIPESLSGQFLHCHQGYWVNFSMIEEMDRDEFVLKGGERVPISRTFRDSARKTFFERYHLS